MKVKTAFLWIAAAIIISTLACLAEGLNGSLPSSPGDESGLLGTSWSLVEIEGDQPIAASGSFPTITFGGGQAFGSASCNYWGAAYTVDGNNLSFGEVEITEIMCETPSGIMAQEDAFVQLLNEAERFDIQDNRLTIFTSSAETLVFQELGT